MGAFDVPQPLIPDLIAQHGRWQSGKTAVVQGDRTLSWQQFDAATNRVGNALAAAGMHPGARVAVLMTNSIEMLAILFGAGKAGVSAVPLNPSISDAAIATMLKDCQAGAVVASGELCRRIDALAASGSLSGTLLRVAVGFDGPGWQSCVAFCSTASALRPDVSVVGASECNIIYSSGTTGLPKGIVHSHQCRMNWAGDLAIALRYHSGAVTVCSLGLFSNISWVAMLSTILVGGTLVIMPGFTAEGLIVTIERERVTHGAFAPVQLQRVLELPDLAAHDLGSLQTIMCCGSPLAPTTKLAVRDSLRCDLIELYGLTEGIITTLAPEDFDRKLESVGKPAPGQQLEILTDDDRIAARGEAGEIVGCGRLVMDEYLNRADATAEATWTDVTGKRWLRTGDIGRLDADGFLTIVDRKKDMILSGGQNIFPADIEMVMREHPDVADVAVVGVPSARWGETPLAVVVLRERRGTGASADDLITWTNARVGKQQRISRVVTRASLPRNPNGKVLKRELRAEFARS
jgi:acyl-CoA synthetase (AMP-forming)/AMP-acid ligase II